MASVKPGKRKVVRRKFSRSIADPSPLTTAKVATVTRKIRRKGPKMVCCWCGNTKVASPQGSNSDRCQICGRFGLMTADLASTHPRPARPEPRVVVKKKAKYQPLKKKKTRKTSIDI